MWAHRALIRLSAGYSLVRGRLDTRYSPVRRSPSKLASKLHAAPRLACVKPVASVHPEPGSNSSLYIFVSCLLLITAALTRRPDFTNKKGGLCLRMPLVSICLEFKSSSLSPKGARDGSLTVCFYPRGKQP